MAPVDSFKATAEGRCRFRTADLLRMADLVDGLVASEGEGCKGNYAASVKQITPLGADEARAEDSHKQPTDG